jgi:hypothetical protein
MEMTSTAQASKLPGILFVWTNVDPAHETDFNRWYDREHVEERVRIPGFVSGSRYQSTQGTRRYLGLYRTTSLDAFRTPAYFQAFQHQTPWSVSNLARMQGPMRRVCEIDAETGMGTGAWLAVLRLGDSMIGRQPAEVAKLGKALLALDGVVSSKVLIPNVELSTPLPAENPNGRVLDPILLIEASSEPAAANASRFAAEQIGTEVDSLSILQLTWQLREQDLQDKAA